MRRKAGKIPDIHPLVSMSAYIVDHQCPHACIHPHPHLELNSQISEFKEKNLSQTVFKTQFQVTAFRNVFFGQPMSSPVHEEFHYQIFFLSVHNTSTANVAHISEN